MINVIVSLIGDHKYFVAANMYSILIGSVEIKNNAREFVIKILAARRTSKI